MRHQNHAAVLDGQGDTIVDKSLEGYLAVGVPGTVLGLETARQRYGTLPRTLLLAPAIRLATEGFTLTRGDVDVLADANDAFRKQSNVSAIFLNNGKPLQPGNRLVQKDLAHTLRAISERGSNAFYRGPIADAVVAASIANGGGLIIERDFPRGNVGKKAQSRQRQR